MIVVEITSAVAFFVFMIISYKKVKLLLNEKYNNYVNQIVNPIHIKEQEIIKLQSEIEDALNKRKEYLLQYDKQFQYEVKIFTDLSQIAMNNQMLGHANRVEAIKRYLDKKKKHSQMDDIMRGARANLKLNEIFIDKLMLKFAKCCKKMDNLTIKSYK